MNIELIQMGKKLLHHLALERGHDTIQVIYDLLLCCFEIMGDHFLLIHLIVGFTIDGFSGNQVFQNVARTFPIDILDCAGQLDIRSLQHFLETVQFPGAFADKALAIPYQFPQLTLVFVRDKTGLEKSMLEKIGNPFRIFYICLPSWDSLHVVCIYHHSFQVRIFKDVIQRFPIRGSAFHGSHLTAAFFEPVCQFKKFSGCCTKLTHFLLVAFSEIFVHINTTTFVVNFIHNGTSMDEFTAWYSVCYHFTVRPSAASGWTDGGANEST